ncbi:acetyl-CoA carboxylase biotin carboxylase subunit [Salirhabdus salicampi]|uniref:acetyl-CoA carboxylase biotin carboxylase subunit n=1 Tax=Salirhabdus salicampi TaxID=476102 RepID=UPI0020C59976|nr:acetyl-CoA carboxylase biotin carboxylase subunit [Salirhabdus salicampi]MCP8616388.1 acetyl-CoA carboxylase biotin carboxylase subunit [Salirhabdus salicampi]
MPFQKILIANRGEIAVRIMKTCQKLNIPTVAVYSEADEDAPFVKLANESYPIGGKRVHESYLNMGKIIDCAKKAGADAIHPGYGLLSENPTFAKRCNEAGITFIGPSSRCIEMMGSKIKARQTMRDAGVPVIPGSEDAIEDVDTAVSFARNIGYPVMLKASAGGGGIGMQIVHTEDELVKAFESNARKAENFFGDGTMFIEKVIEDAHHVEIQLLADHYGNVLHVFERECSVQRRHQKIIEEAPSPLLNDDTRQKMGDAAIKAARAIDYTNAGTIEFLVDEKQNYYFLEMNTRLQVEHPVTEEVTGIDIVEQQIHIAAHKPLKWNQEDLQINGHAIEVRIYAEDPTTFFPSPGRIQAFSPPTGSNIRNEIGVQSSYMVSPFYDPMIAKLITKGKTRTDAIQILKNALAQYEIEGIKTNLPFLLKVIDHPLFQKGVTRTSFIEKQFLKEET